MALHDTNPTTTEAWQKLQKHFQEMNHVSIKELFNADNARAEKIPIK